MTRMGFQPLLARRPFLQVGGIGALGMTLPALWQAEAVAGSTGQRGSARPRSCIFIFLYGGPSQVDTWDMKPEAPDSVRGEFRPIATAVPGTYICEHLPRMAQLARHYSIVRGLHHSNRSHNPASSGLLTGTIPMGDIDGKLERVGPNDAPALGSLAARLSPPRTNIPAYVHLPARCYFDAGFFFKGQAAGWLGTAYDPLLIQQDPSSPSFHVDGYTRRQDIPPERLLDRRHLLASLERGAANPNDSASLGAYQQRALDLLTGQRGRTAFDLTAEPQSVRDRYGNNMLGQSCLLARRLIEAGTRLVTVADCKPNGHHLWDTHDDNFGNLKTLLPRLDQAYSALLEDLLARGLLEDTVVYLGGEFGRTPRVGQSIGSATSSDGRDHWPRCFCGVLAGGLLRPGIVYGASDRHGGYPNDGAMTPADLAATIFRGMGLDPETMVVARDGRPMPASTGTAVAALL